MVFVLGGTKWEKKCIQVLQKSISMRMEEEVMDGEQDFGKLNSKNSHQK
jgi:hypothetical protein